MGQRFVRTMYPQLGGFIQFDKTYFVAQYSEVINGVQTLVSGRLLNIFSMNPCAKSDPLAFSIHTASNEQTP